MITYYVIKSQSTSTVCSCNISSANTKTRIWSYESFKAEVDFIPENDTFQLYLLNDI